MMNKKKATNRRAQTPKSTNRDRKFREFREEGPRIGKDSYKRGTKYREDWTK